MIRIVLPLFFLGAITQGQHQILPLNDWRMQQGDNPAWAKPDFNDSSWAQSQFPDQTWYDTPGWRWYRTSVTLAQTEDLAIGIGRLNRVYEVYVDGKLVGQFGNAGEHPSGPVDACRVFRLPARPAGGLTHIAIRRWLPNFPQGWTEFQALGVEAIESQPPAVGSRSAIELREALYTARGELANLPWNLAALLMLGVAAISFVLYATQGRRKEYLYLGLFSALTEGGGGFLGMPMVLHSGIEHRTWWPVLVLTASMSGWVWAILLLAQICPRYRRWIYWIAGAQALVGGTVVLGYAMDLAAVARVIRLLDVAAAAASLLAVWGLARDRSGSVWIGVALAIQYLGGMIATFADIEPHIHAGILQIDIRSVATLVCVSTILFVLYRRFRVDQARQAAIEQEFNGAKRVQEALLGGTLTTPGFTVEIAYQPAREVGGDFYQCIPGDDGSLLVVVGDVSGKGLDAAMLVATVLGAPEQ